jgi:hypothetical protein
MVPVRELVEFRPFLQKVHFKSGVIGDNEIPVLDKSPELLENFPLRGAVL